MTGGKINHHTCQEETRIRPTQTQEHNSLCIVRFWAKPFVSTSTVFWNDPHLASKIRTEAIPSSSNQIHRVFPTYIQLSIDDRESPLHGLCALLCCRKKRYGAISFLSLYKAARRKEIHKIECSRSETSAKGKLDRLAESKPYNLGYIYFSILTNVVRARYKQQRPTTTGTPC